MAAKAEVVQPAFGEWLRDRKNRRSVPHRFEDCQYVVVRNPHDSEGRWKIGGGRHTIYGQDALTVPERIKAAQELVAELGGSKRGTHEPGRQGREGRDPLSALFFYQYPPSSQITSCDARA